MGDTYLALPMMNVRIRKTNAGVLSVVKTGDNDPGSIQSDFIERESGVLQDIKEVQRYTTALNDPAQYLTDKVADLNSQTAILQAVYDREFKQSIIDGNTVEQAQATAKKFMMQRKKELMVDHNKKYPLDVKKAARRKIEGKY